MAKKSVARFLRHGVIYRVGFFDFNKNMVLLSKKSDSKIVISLKIANFGKSPW